MSRKYFTKYIPQNNVFLFFVRSLCCFLNVWIKLCFLVPAPQLSAPQPAALPRLSSHSALSPAPSLASLHSALLHILCVLHLDLPSTSLQDYIIFLCQLNLKSFLVIGCTNLYIKIQKCPLSFTSTTTCFTSKQTERPYLCLCGSGQSNSAKMAERDE